LSEAERFLLFNCVATYLELDGRAAEEYRALLQETEDEEVQAMAMTWAEKVEEKGRQEGMQSILLRMLRQRFKALPPATTQRVSAMTSSKELERLADRLLSASSLEELGLA
jgi:hypothetical protein